MKKTWMIRVLLLAGYCVPFAYLSVNGDAAFGTMLYYVLMVAGFALLCLGALKTNNTNIVFVGNLLSFASSYITAKLSGLEPMGYYFKPLTSYSLIVCISVVAMILQAMIVGIGTSKKNRKSRKRS